ncbi:MAG TPA: glycosyltransferase, partial [Bacillales bacterium]|nr:glycosyltransferase [Bacillales bacterium]
MKVLHIISGGETGGSRKHLVTLLAMFPKDEVSLLVFQKGLLSQEAEEAGIPVYDFGQRSRYDLRVLNRLTSFINDHQFDIVHTHGPRSNLYGLFIHRKIQAAWVTTVHSDPGLDFMDAGVKGKLFSWAHKRALRRVDFLFAVSDRFKRILLSYGIPEQRIKTIHNGITFQEDPGKSEISRNHLGLKEEDFVITMVARLHPVKGHELVFQALEQLNNPRVNLLLVGNGPIQEELQEKATNLTLRRNVRFLGFRKDVEHLFSMSDTALLASYSESFPFVLLEAAKVKTPVITSDVGDVEQLV